MEEKRDESKPYDCFVAFLDIMGFKDRLFRKGHEAVNESLDSLSKTIKYIEKSSTEPWLTRIVKSPGKADVISKPSAVIPVIFSDSIILVSGDDSDLSVPFMLLYIDHLFYEALKKGLPMKGAIAHGMMTADRDKSLFFGQPLIDAFELHEELLLYGIVLHHTMEKQMNNLKILNIHEGKDIYKYPVPMKSGKIKHYLVDWSYHLEEDNSIDLIKNLSNDVSGKPRLYIDNTLKFLDFLKEEKP